MESSTTIIVCLAPVILRLFHSFREDNLEPGAVRAIQLNFAFQLLYHHDDQLETQ